MKIEFEPADDSMDERVSEDLAYRRSLDLLFIEDWEEYAGDSLESAGMIDEYYQGWHTGNKRGVDFKTEAVKNILNMRWDVVKAHTGISHAFSISEWRTDQALAILHNLPTDLPRDEVPFVWPNGTRSMFSHGDGIELDWKPRPGYEQDKSKYNLKKVGE